MAVVSDSGPLVYLAKLGKLSLLRQLFNEIIIPVPVRHEVVDRGKAAGYSDAFTVEDAISEGWIKVSRPTAGEVSRLSRERALGKAEAECIVLARELGTTMLLIDDLRARKTAAMLGLTPHGTLYVLELAKRRTLITKEEYLPLIRRLIQAGFYLPTDVYDRIMSEGRQD